MHPSGKGPRTPQDEPTGTEARTVTTRAKRAKGAKADPSDNLTVWEVVRSGRVIGTVYGGNQPSALSAARGMFPRSSSIDVRPKGGPA
jgi:hypothetical protein